MNKRGRQVNKRGGQVNKRGRQVNKRGRQVNKPGYPRPSRRGLPGRHENGNGPRDHDSWWPPLQHLAWMLKLYLVFVTWIFTSSVQLTLPRIPPAGFATMQEWMSPTTYPSASLSKGHSQRQANDCFVGAACGKARSARLRRLQS